MNIEALGQIGVTTWLDTGVRERHRKGRLDSQVYPIYSTCATNAGTYPNSISKTALLPCICLRTVITWSIAQTAQVGVVWWRTKISAPVLASVCESENSIPNGIRWPRSFLSVCGEPKKASALALFESKEEFKDDMLFEQM